MSEEEPQSGSNTMMYVLIGLAVLIVFGLPCTGACILGGITVLGSQLETQFDEVQRQIEQAP